jgi:hypothetical protein
LKSAGDDAELPRYAMQVVADRVGVPVPTLRSWNRRYDVGPVGHSPGPHRLYGGSDIVVVEVMRDRRRGLIPPAPRAAMDAIAVP